MRSYTENVTGSTRHVVSHNLGTKSIIHNVKAVIGDDEITALHSINVIDKNTIEIKFAAYEGDAKVTVVG